MGRRNPQSVLDFGRVRAAEQRPEEAQAVHATRRAE